METRVDLPLNLPTTPLLPRLLIRLMLLTLLTLPTVGACDDIDDPPDTIYRNGRIYTVDDERRWVEAIAVSGSGILAVGTNASIEALAGPRTRIVDLAQKMVMPGIHDAHTHLLHAGLKWTHECRLPSNAAADAIVTALHSCADKNPGDGWIVAGEYNPNVFRDAPVDKTFLDQAFPDRPVYLYDFSIHHALVNSRALTAAGIDRETPDPPKGIVKRDPATGEATGELVEMATALVTRVIPPYADTVYDDALRFAVRRCHEFGITSIQEASGTRRLLQMYREFDHDNALNLYVTAHIVWGSEKWGDASPAALDTLISERAAYATRHVDVNATKIWMDGAPLPPNFSEAGIDPATDIPDERNLLVNVDALAEKLTAWRAENIRPKIHVAGAGAARVALDAIERVYGNANLADGPRPELAHNDLVDSSDIGRYGELGVIAEMSPAIWHLGNLEGFGMVNDWWPFASLLDAGAQLTIGSDWILTADPNLFPALSGAVTRVKESVTLADAIDMMTRNGAAAAGRAEHLGSLEAGKVANFIVLDRDLFAVAPAEIANTRVLLTVFEGNIVYRHDDAPAGWKSVPTH